MPSGASLREPTTSRPTGPEVVLDHRGAEGAGEALGGLPGGGVALVDDADGGDREVRVGAQAGGRDGDRRAAAEQQFVGRDTRLDEAVRGPVSEPKRSCRALLLGDFVEATLVAGLTTTYFGMSGVPTDSAPRASSASAACWSSDSPNEWRT